MLLLLASLGSWIAGSIGFNSYLVFLCVLYKWLTFTIIDSVNHSLRAAIYCKDQAESDSIRLILIYFMYGTLFDPVAPDWFSFVPSLKYLPSLYLQTIHTSHDKQWLYFLAAFTAEVLIMYYYTTACIVFTLCLYHLNNTFISTCELGFIHL